MGRPRKLKPTSPANSKRRCPHCHKNVTQRTIHRHLAAQRQLELHPPNVDADDSDYFTDPDDDENLPSTSNTLPPSTDRVEGYLKAGADTGFDVDVTMGGGDNRGPELRINRSPSPELQPRARQPRIVTIEDRTDSDEDGDPQGDREFYEEHGTNWQQETDILEDELLDLHEGSEESSLEDTE